jgi:uncharacterized protein (TIGR01777 family)
VKVVVTGATGFMGPALVAALRARSHEVTILARNAERAKAALGDGVTIVVADLEARGAWCDSLAGAGAIIHLAGEPVAGKRWTARQKQIIRDSRVEATRTLVEAIAALEPSDRPHVLLSASGTDYYPYPEDAGFDDDEVTESAAPSESFLGRVCRDWEREAMAAGKLGVRVACMRTGIVLGHGGPLAKMTTPFKLFVGGKLGDGKQWLSWIHLDDAIAAYVAALDDDRYAGAFNLVTDSTRNREFSKALGKALGRASWAPVPSFVIKLALGEFAEVVLNGRRVVAKRLTELGFRWKHPELDEALRSATASPSR